MTPTSEADVEDWVISLLQEQGYSFLSPEEQETGRPGVFRCAPAPPRLAKRRPVA